MTSGIRNILVGLVILGFAVPTIVFSQMAQGPGKAADTIQTQSQQPFGDFLTDGNGRAVYMFMQDQQGSGNSTCYDACAQEWPPVLASSNVQATRQAQQNLLGTIQRKDGSSQVTYDGWPLYYFVKDQGSGQVAGQDVKGFGAEWYILGPDGSVIRKEASSN